MTEYFDHDDLSDMAADGHGPSDAGYGRADELASAWFDEGVTLDEQSLSTDDTARLADLAFLNALLERMNVNENKSTANEHSVEANILRVMDSIGVEESQWTHETLAEPVSVQRSRFRSVLRWGVSSATAASLLLAFGWYWISLPGRTAHAAVERAYLEAIELQDRQYHVVTEMRISTAHTMSVESELTVRGGEKFTLRHPAPLGQCWIGSNGAQGWFVPAVGVPRTENDPVIAMEWARKQGVGLPDLHVSALIDYLATWYDLELLPNETLPGQGQIPWQRVRGTHREPRNDRIQWVELWAHPRTGVAQRIVLRWDREPHELGLCTITVNLAGEKQVADSWYEARSHQPLPILPFPPIVPLLQP